MVLLRKCGDPDSGSVHDQSVAHVRCHVRIYLFQHCIWGSQLYAWADTSNRGGWYVKYLLKLQPAYSWWLRQPEVLLHGNTILGNRNTLHPEQFKVRSLRDRIIDRGISLSPKNPFFSLEYASGQVGGAVSSGIDGRLWLYADSLTIRSKRGSQGK